MLLYKTTATDKTTGNIAISFQGSQTESSKARTGAKAHNCKAESQTIEVPTNKSGLLEWLNANVGS